MTMPGDTAPKTSLQKTQALTRSGIWRPRKGMAYLLSPVSWVFGLLTRTRAALYRRRWLSSEHPGRPVIVVGNVIAGGAGKTPVVMALVKHLRHRGWTPGVISRGYGRTTRDCREVFAHSNPKDVGDEPLLIARLTGAPLFVARQRIEAAKALLSAHPEVNVLVCDDGLQHLALERDVEICVFNEEGLGNGMLLPAGPLREPWPRKVDAVLYAGSAPHGSPSARFPVARSLASCGYRADGQQAELSSLIPGALHALAGVARPEQFFSALRDQGLELHRTTPLADHFDFDSAQGMWDEREVLICTEKDAIKLWRHRPDAWAVPLQTRIDPDFFSWLDGKLPPHRSTPLSSPPA